MKNDLLYAVAVMACKQGQTLEDLSYWHQVPGLVIAQSAAEAVSRAIREAGYERFPEAEGYGHHQAVAMEVTGNFLALVRELGEQPDRQHETAIEGELVEEIITDSEASM